MIAARKSIHLSRPFAKNNMITADDIIMKRPGNGISPMQIDSVIGKKVNKDLPEGYSLTWSDFD